MSIDIPFELNMNPEMHQQPLMFRYFSHVQNK